MITSNQEATATKKKKRSYRGHVQAEVRALTRQRIIEAAIDLYAEFWIDQLTFEQVAQRAGVTIQTVYRHFKNKETLIGSITQYVVDTEVAKRAEVPAGNLDAIVTYLMDHYEAQGDQVLRGLAQEGRYPAIGELMEQGRIQHQAWVARVFGPTLEQKTHIDRERLLAQLVAVCDVYTWKLLRRQAGLNDEQTALALRELLIPLIA